MDRRAGSRGHVFGRVCLAGVALVAALAAGLWAAAAPSAATQTAERIVVVDASSSVAIEGMTSARLLVAPGVGSITVAVPSTPEVVRVGLSTATCPASGTDVPDTVTIDASVTAPSAVSVCLYGIAAGSASVSVIGSDGSHATLTAKVAGEPTTPMLPAPKKLTVVAATGDATLAVRPPFELASDLEAVANGPNDTATVTLSTNSFGCPVRKAGETTTTTTTSPTPDRVNVVACGVANIGSYTATFDLDGPDTDGGELEVTVIRRQGLWVAYVFAALGVLLSAGFVFGQDQLSKQRKQVDEQTILHRVDGLFRGVRDPLSSVGVDVAGWAPSLWPSLDAQYDGDRGPDAADYERAVESAPPVVALLAALRAVQAGGSELGKDVAATLAAGITLRGDTKPASRANALRAIAVDAATVLARWEANESERDSISQKKLGAAAEAIRATLRAGEAFGPGGPADGGRRPVAPAGRWEPASPKLLSLPELLRSERLVTVILFVASVAVSIVISMGDALDLYAVWGTPKDIVKLFAVTATVPPLVEQLRKIVLGSADA